MPTAIVVTTSNKSFLVETDDSVSLPELHPDVAERLPGLPPGMAPVVDRERLHREFAEVEEVIVTCCDRLFAALRRIPDPERIGVEFGVKLAGEAGVPMLTKASAEANFKVTVDWRPPPDVTHGRLDP